VPRVHRLILGPWNVRPHVAIYDSTQAHLGCVLHASLRAAYVVEARGWPWRSRRRSSTDCACGVRRSWERSALWQPRSAFGRDPREQRRRHSYRWHCGCLGGAEACVWRRKAEGCREEPGALAPQQRLQYVDATG